MTPPPGSADLHVHTTHSDGGCSPAEVVRAAANAGLAALAITDHDTLSALPVARPEAARLGVELIPGVEITAEHEGREYHLLAYFVRDDHPELVATCHAMRAAREGRVRLLVEGLIALGLRVDLEAIRRAFPRATIGRRHLADWLVRSGQCPDRGAVFERYLGDSGPVRAPKPRLDLASAIALVGRSGGVAALAHPPYDLTEARLEGFVRAGLAGIETAGPGVPKSRGGRLRAWAERFDLVPTAGSDFHANDRPGRWVGSVATPPDQLARLRARAS